ncbi:MAG: 1-acyl-sn-glycerol-3-phosphate acyltransferase [Coriobacteriia bacterium]|nr:1-acyl-sn-glycerol-3-phosphate acyltransferase [Coriobacteriia bacterium]
MTREFTGLPATGDGAPSWRLARLLRRTVGPLILATYRTRIIGIENVPADGGYILAGNHVSYLDPVLMWCAAPRETHFIAKSELFEVKPLKWLLSRVWVFPIARDSADREAIQRATSLLGRGEPVGMFPEGTRRRAGAPVDDAALGEAHSGVAFIAMRAAVPVVPVGIANTDLALPAGAKIPRFPRVTLTFGEPVWPDLFQEGGRKERTAAMTSEIMRRVAAARDAAGRE